jgi:diguanylate cyclase (GGDEF)-like protein
LENLSKNLQPIDLLKVYGSVSYDWDLKSDCIDWHGPIHRLLSFPESFMTGNSFHHKMNLENFMIRLNALDKARHHQGIYDCEYAIFGPQHNLYRIHDHGTISYGEQGRPLKIMGALRFLGKDECSHKNLSGYDELTGYPNAEVLYENLASILTESEYTGIPGAYLLITIDSLNHYNCSYGIQTVLDIMQSVGEKLRKTIRFNDVIGRVSGCCFAVVLKECDRWGIIRASERLISAIESIRVHTPQGIENLKMSVGGIVFPENDLKIVDVIQQSEKCLFESQGSKNVISPWDDFYQGYTPESLGQKKPMERRKAETLRDSYQKGS